MIYPFTDDIYRSTWWFTDSKWIEGEALFMTSQGSRDGGCFHPDTNLGYSPRMERTFRFARDLVVLNVGNGGILDEKGNWCFFSIHSLRLAHLSSSMAAAREAMAASAADGPWDRSNMFQQPSGNLTVYKLENHHFIGKSSSVIGIFGFNLGHFP